MEKVSKNIYKGEQITDPKEILRLALKRESVVQKVHYTNCNYIVRPAAFYLSWQLRMILNSTFYYAVKLSR